MKISVIIPTYRRPDLLNSCISALYRQTFDKKDFEIIVVSDGPDELTKKEMKLWAGKKNLNFSFMELPDKSGPAAARNRGWLKAKGLLIAFTDDDCIPDKTWLKKIYDAYHGENEIAFSGKVHVPISSFPTDHELNTSHLEKAEFITANCVCTKQALIKTGGFDERFALAWREDSDLHFKLIQNNIPLCKIDAAVTHPVRQAGWGMSLREQKKGMFNALLYKKYPELYRDKIQAKAPWNYYAFIAAFAGLTIGLLMQSGQVTVFSLVCWLLLLVHFTLRRLNSTSRSVAHVLEMALTSIAIPFLSVYWQFYGAWKYRVLFI